MSSTLSCLLFSFVCTISRPFITRSFDSNNMHGGNSDEGQTVEDTLTTRTTPHFDYCCSFASFLLVGQFFVHLLGMAIRRVRRSTLDRIFTASRKKFMSTCTTSTSGVPAYIRCRRSSLVVRVHLDRPRPPHIQLTRLVPLRGRTFTFKSTYTATDSASRCTYT